MNTNLTDEKPELVLSYEFDFPRETVFNAFSTSEAMGQWWGPVECKNSSVHMDFRPGGTYHFKMEMEGKTNYGLFQFITVQPHDLLEFTNSFADEKANIIAAPFDIPLSKEIFYRLEFTEIGGKTTITIKGHPVNPTKEESDTYIAIKPGMNEGFGATFKALGKYLQQG
jgi:uncharacterized protein YndB with AHSA1/START domain